jgi:hypothetical protein
MAVPKQLDHAAEQLRRAGARIEAARQQPLSMESVREWLEGLTEFASALSDVQGFNNESVHEKLHDLAARVGLKTFPGERPRPRQE